MVGPPLRFRRWAGRGQNRPLSSVTVPRPSDGRWVAHPIRTVDGFWTPFAQVSQPKCRFLHTQGGGSFAPPHSGKRGQMGDVIRLSERRAALRPWRPAGLRSRSRAELFFDLACPFTYLVAERIERAFDEVAWRPAYADALCRSSLARNAWGGASVRRAAEERAAALRLPLVWPERFPAEVPAAMRVAAYAAEAGRGAAFRVAATRLAFCGGFALV